MISVEHLTKRYAGNAAVDDVSFEVGQGEVVGFLGPNGAGKSTTMRILSSYLPPTAGRVTIAGHDVFRESIKARRELGYMPENVPLYEDMRVKEYLHFRAQLKGLRGRDARQRSGEVMELCGVTEVRKKMISSLSKGYRQRLGLADALVHRPRLLILDEPTNGLDPNQIRQVRELIRQLGERHTILLSTHILPEVEATCGRVIIIDRGKIKASDTPENLQQRLRTAGYVEVELRADEQTVAAKLRELPNVRRVLSDPLADGWRKFTLRMDNGSDLRESIYQMALANRWPLRELTRKMATLEDVFVEITQN
ncbi:MAG: ABC transporter ATP-binding protein [Verrucomicrobiales bacterium]